MILSRNEGFTGKKVKSRYLIDNRREEPITLLHRNRHFVPGIIIALLILLFIPGCSRVVRGGFFTLENGQTVSGNLWVPFGTVVLQQGSQVNGSVLMLCCTLVANGKVDGDIFLIFGDLNLDSISVVNGDVVLLSGFYQRTMGSTVGGGFTSSMTPDIYKTILRPFQICLAAILIFVLAVITLIVVLVIKKKRQNPGSNLSVGSLEGPAP
jgi:hypothetical protein